MIIEVESLGKPSWTIAWVRVVPREQKGHRRDIEEKYFEDKTNHTYL